MTFKRQVTGGTLDVQNMQRMGTYGFIPTQWGRRWSGSSWVEFYTAPVVPECAILYSGGYRLSILHSQSTNQAGTEYRVRVGGSVKQEWSTNTSGILLGQTAGASFSFYVQSRFNGRLSIDRQFFVESGKLVAG